MQDLAHWLEELGMSEYAQRFAENRIDFSVLPDLTDSDLKDIGVVLGDRRKILRAIAKLGETSVAPASVPAPASQSLSASTPPPTAETVAKRRQVTVMFSDLVGSTNMGDGLLVYFGYPRAHEDDAERAVRGGLELIQAVGGLKSSAPLQTRAGIATAQRTALTTPPNSMRTPSFAAPST
jgi:hypothetical protein